MSAYKIANCTSTDHLAKTTLPALPRKECLNGFAVTYVAGNIVLAGGISGRDKSAQTYLMDLQTDRWMEESQPALNVARC